MKRKKVLFITNKNFITRSDSGGRQGSLKTYNLCAQAFGEENVTVLVFTDETGIEKCMHEKKMTGKVVYLHHGNLGRYYNMLWLRDGYSKKQEKEIRDYINVSAPDIVVLDGTTFGRLIKTLKGNTKIVASYHNIEKRYASSRIFRSNPIWLIRFLSYWYNEYYISKYADIHICLNHRDSALLYKSYHVRADYLLPVTFKDVGEENINTEKNESGILLFVGSYFMPNVKGIKWFCKNVMPQLQQKLLIIGNGMERLRKQLTSCNVEVVGTVENIEQYYNNASAVVMPIFVGDGMKVKTAQAMMYGKPIFATNEALEGYEVNGVSGIYRCNTKEEFIRTLKSSPEKGYVKEIRDLFLNKYSTKALEEETIHFLRNV